jgi:hypothetical protein
MLPAAKIGKMIAAIKRLLFRILAHGFRQMTVGVGSELRQSALEPLRAVTQPLQLRPLIEVEQPRILRVLSPARWDGLRTTFFASVPCKPRLAQTGYTCVHDAAS